MGVAALLGIGLLVGWIYGNPLFGVMVAALAALAWQIRQLIALDRAINTSNFEAFRFGEGLWQQIVSRFRYERDRGDRYKRDFRRLLKEVRKSTNAMPDGAVILDQANEIIICNRAAKTLAGLKRKKDRGQRVDNLLRDPELIRLLGDNDPSITIDIPSPVRDGHWLNCRVVPYGANQKLMLLRDVTDRITLNRMRRDFVANASHELRSPLTVIAGYVDALVDDDEVPSSWAQPLAQMRDQAGRMTRIVKELLELSRLESAGRASDEESVDVGGLFAAVRKTLQVRQESPSIELEIDSTAQLLGDRNEIESLISNLLSNAIRHTPRDGSITLRWRSDQSGADLVVTDTGEGIGAEHIPRLTERFFRVDRGRSRADGGVGLGLAIVKHVLGRHDGELHINSEPGQGSTFRCHFPRERVVIHPPIPLTGSGPAN